MGKIIELGKNFKIDLDKLISTRMLIQANSGGGKSYAIRKLLEESHGQVQQIVIDLEGEFSSLREEYDYLLVGPDGEIPTRIQTAELLARKLLKINVSTIIDLSELKHHERILFVKRFLDSLVNAPKTLWHPCLVIVDEAHQFCPEKTKSESGSSVIDLCTRGRKRGFCAVLATQRISKLNKDAAAECNNNLVGRTMLDIDQKRAADTLGINNKDEIRNLRNLGDGEFWIFGPAIGKEVKKIQVERTKTIHMDSKNILSAPTPTPKNIEKLMKDVIDLPKEAEEELNELVDYKNKVAELKRDLRKAQNSQPKPLIQINEKEIKRARQFGFAESEKLWKEKWKEVVYIQKNLKYAQDFIKQFMDRGSKLLQIEVPDCTQIVPRLAPNPALKPLPPQTPTSPMPQSPSVTISHPESPLGICPRKIYSVLLANPDTEFTKVQLGLLSGYSAKSGGFNNAISALNSRGLLQRNHGKISIDEINSEYSVDGFRTVSKELWSSSLPLCPRTIFEFLLRNNQEEHTRESMGISTGYSHTSGGFKNAISKLNYLGLIQRNNGLIRISPEILEL